MHRVGEQKMSSLVLRKRSAIGRIGQGRCQLTDGHNLRMTSPAATTPRIELEDGVATLTLNRPAHRNRLEDADLRALMEAFDRFNADPQVRVVVITANTTGQPRPVFCAGYHIGDFDGPDHDPAMFERVADALANLRAVTVCALNGSVHGGATDLALACDLRVAAEGEAPLIYYECFCVVYRLITTVEPYEVEDSSDAMRPSSHLLKLY